MACAAAEGEETMGCSISATGKVVPLRSRTIQREQSAGSIVCTREAESAPPSEDEASNLTIIHFNDVYNIEEREREPVGGAARFKTRVAGLSGLNPLILFSGDALNPSNSECVGVDGGRVCVVVECGCCPPL